MRHALALTGAVDPLSIIVIGPTLGACLVPVPGPLHLLPSRYDATIARAVPVTPIAPTADVKVVSAPAASPPPKLLHPTPRAEEPSTGDPSPITISSETKRLHPRGDSAATGSPVSSTGGDDPRPVRATRPVSGLAEIPRYAALAMIDGPRFAVFVSSDERPWSQDPLGEGSSHRPLGDQDDAVADTALDKRKAGWRKGRQAVADRRVPWSERR